MLKKIAALIVILALLGFATLMGWIPWQQILSLGRQSTARARGSIGTMGTPSTASPADQKAAQQCCDMLRRVHTAKAAIRSKTGYEVKNISWDEVLREMGGAAMPKCPKGGTYQLGTMQEVPRCTIAGNGTSDTGDDHLIRN